MKQIDELSKRITKTSKKGYSSSKGSATTRTKISTPHTSSQFIKQISTPRIEKSVKIPDLNNSKINASFFGDVSTSIKQYFSSKIFTKKKPSSRNVSDNEILKDL